MSFEEQIMSKDKYQGLLLSIVPPAYRTFISGHVAMLRVTGQLVARDLVRTCIRDELNFVKNVSSEKRCCPE